MKYEVGIEELHKLLKRFQAYLLMLWAPLSNISWTSLVTSIFPQDTTLHTT